MLHGKGWRKKVGTEGRAGATAVALTMRIAQAYMTGGKY